MITLQQFKKMIPTNKEPEQWYEIALEMFPKYDITTVNRIAGFMAQAGHESLDFRVVQENLNYSESNLLKTFPRYFTKATAKQYARKPEMIANHVYDDDNRTSKLGNTQPGDGWKFRGRGLIQLTGRWNYEKFGADVGKTADQVVEYLETKQGAMESALWFWKVNNINQFADSDDIKGMSRRVNGGDNGLIDRTARYNKNKSLMMAAEDVILTPTVSSNMPLRRGSKGEDVRVIQRVLNLPADGIFGIITEAAVRSWQRTNRFPITGKINTEQLEKMKEMI